MRFEIGPGGGFVVLVGLLGLSAAVFFLGMISGREMAQSEQGQSQLASVYPMPAGAPPAAPPQAAAAPAAPAAAEEPGTDSSAPSDSSASTDEADTGTDEGTASAPPPRAGTHGKGYNIVIDAAMDRGAANRM